jgi:hypothetical protein
VHLAARPNQRAVDVRDEELRQLAGLSRRRRINRDALLGLALVLVGHDAVDQREQREVFADGRRCVRGSAVCPTWRTRMPPARTASPPYTLHAAILRVGATTVTR